MENKDLKIAKNKKRIILDKSLIKIKKTKK